MITFWNDTSVKEMISFIYSALFRLFFSETSKKTASSHIDATIYPLR